MEQALSLISKYSSRGGKPTASTGTCKEALQSPYEASLVQNPEVSHQEAQRLKQIQRKMSVISQAQQALHQKCKKIIQNLTNQIKLKDQNNMQLEEEIKQLKEGIETSKADLAIIVNYIAKLNKKENRNYREEKSRQKLVLDSTKDSGCVDKSSSGFARSPIGGSGSSNKLKDRSRPTLTLFQGAKTRRNKSDLFLS